ncbi:MAG: hypothetical protein WD824_04090 [Cyclobacteriaceae bacterium]
MASNQLPHGQKQETALLSFGPCGFWRIDYWITGKVKTFLAETRCHVGVLVDKDFEVADRIVVMLGDFNDLFLISFAERFIIKNNARVVLSDPNRLIKSNITFSMAVEKINGENPQKLEVYESHSLDAAFIQSFNVLLISTSGWKDLSKTRNSWMPAARSILILKPQGNAV